MKFKWFVIGTLATAAAAAACVLLKRKLDASNEAALPAPEDAGAECPQKNRAAVIADGIRSHAPVFDGLYEGLFQAARNRQLFSTDAYEEWCDRMERMEDEAFAGAFAAAFSKADIADEARCREKYDNLLACIAQADIVRERENGVPYPADEAMARAYLAIDGSAIEIGKVYIVVKSAWISGEKVIEYGMVMRGA